MGDTQRYHHRFDRETPAVGWTAPDGRQFLVCGTDSGYALRAPQEWESDDEVEFQADADGNVYMDGESTGWRIPSEVLSRTIA